MILRAGPRRIRRRRVAAVESGPLLFDGRADVAHARARRVHLPGLGRDVDAHGALESVRLPRGDVALAVARRDEAIVIAAMSAAFAAAETRHIAQHFRM